MLLHIVQQQHTIAQTNERKKERKETGCEPLKWIYVEKYDAKHVVNMRKLLQQQHRGRYLSSNNIRIFLSISLPIK